jgi:hypothetical protein
MLFIHHILTAPIKEIPLHVQQLPCFDASKTPAAVDLLPTLPFHYPSKRYPGDGCNRLATSHGVVIFGTSSSDGSPDFGLAFLRFFNTNISPIKSANRYILNIGSMIVFFEDEVESIDFLDHLVDPAVESRLVEEDFLLPRGGVAVRIFKAAEGAIIKTRSV